MARFKVIVPIMILGGDRIYKVEANSEAEAIEYVKANEHDLPCRVTNLDIEGPVWEEATAREI